MKFFLELLRNTLISFTVFDAVDILLVWALVYYTLKFVIGTRGFYILIGILVLLLLNAFAYYLGLYALSWIMKYANIAIFIALPIVFQPELRSLLAHLGEQALVNPFEVKTEEVLDMIDNLVEAVSRLSQKKIGALIVLEREESLEEYIRRGVSFESDVNPLLLESIFYKESPLHDGAVIIRGVKVVAAGCYLPIAIEVDLPPEYGARHRAALGISQISDAIAIVVSEETGKISVCYNGELYSGLSLSDLRSILKNALYQPKEPFKGFIKLTFASKIVPQVPLKGTPKTRSGSEEASKPVESKEEKA